MKIKENRGVTLIALAVTIIIMLILAGVTISTLTGNSGISSNANQARIQNELAQYKEQMELYLAEKKVENYDFFIESLNAGKESLIYDGKPDDEKGNIKTIIPSITDEYIECLQIINGELYIKTKDEKKIKAAQQLAIQVNPFDIADDGELLSTKENLKLINGEGTLALPSLVSKIGMGAFSGVEGLKTIIIPSSVKEIGDYAFSYNKEIERVVIEGDLKRIGHYAFDQATNLREINLPDSISEIGIFAFRNTQISEVTVPKNVQTISGLTFGNCSKLKKIVLQEGIKSISSYAFKLSSGIKELTFPESLETISGHSLAYMYSIQNINIGKNVKSIDSLFRPGNYSGNINIDSQNPYYVIENKILYKKNNGKKDILVSVLYKIDGTIELDSKVKTIGYYSFYAQSGLKELVIPEGI